MPVITKIAQQKKQKNRYSIFLDNEYAFGVAEDVLISFQLAKGKTLTKEEIADITEGDEYSRAYSLALNFLSYRMRTIQEMEDYLQKKEIPELWQQRIIVKLLEDKLLDDAAFAGAYVRDRIHQTTKGPKIIRQELVRKGIKPEIANQALEQYDADQQYEQALKVLKKERRKKAKHAHKKQEEQLKVKLLQQGFESDVINRVFAENQPEFDLEEEAMIFQKQADKLHRKYAKKLSGFDLEMKLKQALFQRGFQQEMIEPYIKDMKEAEVEEM